jgi:hypothetical protein
MLKLRPGTCTREQPFIMMIIAAFHRWLGLLHLLARDPQGHLLSGFSLQILIHSYRLEVTVWFKRFPTISNDGEAVLD